MKGLVMPLGKEVTNGLEQARAKIHNQTVSKKEGAMSKIPGHQDLAEVRRRSSPPTFTTQSRSPSHQPLDFSRTASARAAEWRQLAPHEDSNWRDFGDWFALA